MSFPVSSSIGSARKAIESRVSAWWVTDEAKAGSAVSWPNVQFSTPTGGPWLQVGIQMGEALPATYGTQSLNRRIGVLFLTVYAPRGDGSALLDGLAARALAKFSRQIAQGIEYVSAAGPFDIGDPAWATAQLQIRFQFWEAVTPGVTL